MLTKTINKILLAGLLSAAVLAPVVAQRNSRNSNAIAEKTSTECAFPNLELPDEFVVYAAGWNSSNWRLDFQIDQSGDMASQRNLVVNSPSKPVVLLLGVDEPNIWNIKWTEDTDIVAVAATGYYRQAVAGLSDETPILISTYDNGAECGYFDDDPTIYGYEEIDSLSKLLFGQSVEKVEVKTVRVETVHPSNWIGELPEDEDPKLFSSNDTSVDSFFDSTAPLSGLAAVEAAHKKGILRRATKEDAKAWMELHQKLHPNKDLYEPVTEEFENAYVVLDKFVYPNGLSGTNFIKFFVPEDVPEPIGNPTNAKSYSFKTGECYGTLCYR